MVKVNKDESRMVTGCSASKIVFWKDVTEEKKLEEIRKLQEKTLKEQELFNLMKTEDFLPALKLALTLERPATVLNIINCKYINKFVKSDVINSIMISYISYKRKSYNTKHFKLYLIKLFLHHLCVFLLFFSSCNEIRWKRIV